MFKMYNILTLVLLAGLVSTCRAIMLDSLYAQLDASCNGTDKFVCRNSKCIEKSKRCDGRNDCLDSSDEEDCDLYNCSEPNYFKCENGKCLYKGFVCDTENDCGDFSDEKNCENFKFQLTHPVNCTSDEWQCTDRLCIPKEFVCNNEKDCLDGSDEILGCTLNIACDGFKCRNGHCIPNEWFCDKSNDCGDNSDEENCQSHIHPKDCQLDKKLFLCDNNITCINLADVCDKTNHCPDNSDERGQCSGPLSCGKHACSHTCVQLPSGPKCLCPEGYETLDDKNCRDIDECDTYGICDQKCTNTPGSYRCSCDERYELQTDGKTCKVVGGEALLLFSSKTEIRAYFLQSQLMYPVAKNLKQVVGVAFDGRHVYWTDIFSEHESIVRSLEDGRQRELLITSGLGAPEDLAIDWITGNIYFTDSEIKHIGVCNGDGSKCTVLVNKDINKPRGIALNPSKGDMYWSDWGKKPEIARAKMDGTGDITFVGNDIKWPNGLAIDYPNERLYWADASLMRLESIRLDGKDRRIILEGITKHPYAVAVFESNLYWSDWSSHSVQSCNKFTGKDHHTLVHEKKNFIYGVHVYHSAMHKNVRNPCDFNFCSDLCLNTGPSNYTCACPQDKELSADKHVCRSILKKQELIIGVGDLLIKVEHKILGRHYMTANRVPVKEIGALAYNSASKTIYTFDGSKKRIVSFVLESEKLSTVYGENIESITSIEYDGKGNNLYWCDEKRKTVEVFSLTTKAHTVLIHDMGGETPISIALVPNAGVMFIAMQRQDDETVHIDRFHVDGTIRTHIIETGLLGPVTLHYDNGLDRVFWADRGTGNIESTSSDGDDRHGFRALQSTPTSITTLSEDLFWVNQNSRRLYWAKKNNAGSGNKKITMDLPEHTETMHLLSVMPTPIATHPCQKNNGDCSHICLPVDQAVKCACPLGMTLASNNLTCTKPKQCGSDEFHCPKTDICISKSSRCNNRMDCKYGEDEQDCTYEKHCAMSQFKCGNGKCISHSLVCDLHFDCEDKSDEQNCSKTESKTCPFNNFKCNKGRCIPNAFVCDGFRDCDDGEDESDCFSSTCSSTQFRCLTGLCIPKAWECDRDFDCPDLSDEHSQCAPHTCSPEQFTCANGLCIDEKFKCNKVDDCGDSSDESECETRQPSECMSKEFQCTSNTSLCIPETARCNGTSECPHHEDEQGCSDCHVDDFVCENKKCVHTFWLCDGTDDCGDGSDEVNCTTGKSFSENKNVPCDNGFRCKSGACIDYSLVCNGIENCYDGSDENGACNSSCKADTHPCDQICQPTPSGPMCFCNKGFALSGDGKTCNDIEECSMDPPVCSQLCTERTGGYICDCYDGYVIRSDKVSCKSVGEQMSMIFVTNNQIHQLSQSNNSLKVLHKEESPKITGLAVDVVNKYIFFSIEEFGSIFRINLQNSSKEYIKEIGQPQKVAIDWITHNLYYVDNDAIEKTIRVCNFIDQRCAKVVALDAHSQVSDFVIDAYNKYMFYSLTNWWVFNNPFTTLYKANLDGSKVTELVKISSGLITGITYDSNRKLIYYVDQHNKNIFRLNYDGTGRSLMFSNISKASGLDLFEDHLYFLTEYGYMSKCKLYGSQRACNSFRLSGYNVDSFAIVQKTKQPKRPNFCDGHVCNHLCVTSDVGIHCLCESGKVVEERADCSEKGRSASERKATFGKHLVTVEEEHSSSSIIAAVLVPFVILLISLIAYYILRKRGATKCDISIRFQNPVYGMSQTENKPMLQPGEHEYSNPCQKDFQVATNAILERASPLIRIED